jgi:hypothetical protein
MKDSKLKCERIWQNWHVAGSHGEEQK